MFFGDYDPDKIQRLMEKFGIKSKKIEAVEVIIKMKKKIITIKKPIILATKIGKKEVYQISSK